MPAGSQSPHSTRIVVVTERLIATPHSRWSAARVKVGRPILPCRRQNHRLLVRPTKLPPVPGRIDDAEARPCALDRHDRPRFAGARAGPAEGPGEGPGEG